MLPLCSFCCFLNRAFTFHHCHVLKMADIGLLDFSPDLVKIRPIQLLGRHIQELAPRWRTCCCCREEMDKQAVQLACCDTIYHIHCIRSFARSKALDDEETKNRPSIFFCPWCSTILDCRPSDIWAFLQEPATTVALRVGEHIDQWLALLSKLRGDVREKFMGVAEEYEKVVGNPKAAAQLPAKIHSVRKICQNEPSALQAFDALYKERRSSFGALLEWREWLIWDSDLEEATDLVYADTMYGHGPNRFTPRIVKRLHNETERSETDKAPNARYPALNLSRVIAESSSTN